MTNTTTTITTKFDPKSLPRWAQNDAKVVARCARDLAYRASVCSATTKQMKDLLKKQA
jgi:hypothetical protein